MTRNIQLLIPGRIVTFYVSEKRKLVLSVLSGRAGVKFYNMTKPTQIKRKYVMGKIILLIFSGFLFLPAFGQISVDLNWKFSQAKFTVYKVTMQLANIDSVKAGYFSFENIINDTFNGKNKSKTKMNSFYENTLKELMKKYEYLVIKGINNNKFSISFTSSDSLKDIISLTRNFDAYIDRKGNNLSFYLSDAVNNQLKMFFGLPNQKVKKDDIWSLGIDLTSYSEFVKCDTFFKKDLVKVINVFSTKQDTIITITYDFVEFFQGTFFMPVKSSIKYYGTAEFSLTKGLWLKYDCIKETDITGIVNSKVKEIYRLELIEDYPEQIIKQIENK